jgi:hypothetical protein
VANLPPRRPAGTAQSCGDDRAVPESAPRAAIAGWESALLALVLSACGQAVPAPLEADEERRPSADELETMRELEAIGYAGASIEAEDSAPHGVTVYDRKRACDGLNLLVSGHAPEAYLYDMSGELLHTWRLPFEAAYPGRFPDSKSRPGAWRRARVEPNGDLFAIFEGVGLIKIDRNSELLWAYGGRAHHELEIAPDGRIYVLTRKAILLPRWMAKEPILEDFITVLDAGGNELSSVSLLECAKNSAYPEVYEAVYKGGDIFHTNSLQLLDGRHAGMLEAFAAGDLLISIRELDRLAVVDLETRRLTWTLAGTWRSQHEPTLLDGGTILLFDNQWQDRRSRVLELDPLSGTELWSYQQEQPGRFFSASCGSCQRLSNGNTLISESAAGRAFEVTPAGDIVWDFHNPFRGGEGGTLIAWVMEMVRLPADFGAEWIDRR